MLSNNLRIFITVAEKGSITETAKELYITQPAVSRAIINLEKELNVKLFYRDRRHGLHLTYVGEKILLYARQMAELENHIYQTSFRENNFVGGKLKIASFPIATSVIVSRALYQYRQEYPYVTVELIDRDPKDVQKLVEEYAVDIGISASPFDAVEHEKLIMDTMVGIFRSDGPEYKVIDLFGDTSNLIFCDSGKKTTIETMKNAHLVRFDDSLIVQNHETVVNMVEQNNGIGVISEFTLNSIPNGLLRCPVYPQIEVEIALIAPSFRDLTPVAVEFARIVKEVVKNDIMSFD